MEALQRVLHSLGRARTGGPLLVAITAAVFLSFALTDTRPPNDHDDFYTAASAEAFVQLDTAPIAEKIPILGQHFAQGDLHPRGPQTVLLVAMDLFGGIRAVFRAVGLPFLLLLVLGTWAFAREVLPPRAALLSAFVCATLPAVLNSSRKWDTQFHAAALTPLGLYLLLRCLRGTGATWRGWAVLGLWQGLRLYWHPITVLDVAVTLAVGGLAAALTARRAGRSLPRTVAAWAAAPATALAIGSYYLGLLPTAPPYSLPNYLRRRGGYMESNFLADADLSSLLGLAYDQASDIVWIHAMPGFVFLLLPGLLLLPWVLRRTSKGSSKRTFTKGPELLVLLVLVQIPAVILATTNEAFLNDWLFLTPHIVVLAFLGLHGSSEGLRGSVGGLRTLWATAILVVGLGHCFVPLGARAIGPDPLDRPTHYRGTFLSPYSRSTSGHLFTTHHLISRLQHPTQALATAMANTATDRPKGESHYGLIDLTWGPQSLAGGNEWRWEVPPGYGGLGMREPSPWPFVFAGLGATRSIRIDHNYLPQFTDWDVPSARWSTESSGDPEPASQKVHLLPEWTVLRLWLSKAGAARGDIQPGQPDSGLPEDLAAQASLEAKRRFPGITAATVLPDPAGTFRVQTVEWDHQPLYLGTVVLLQHPQ